LSAGRSDFTAGIAAEPEPGSFRLLLLGLFAIGWNLRSRRPSPVAWATPASPRRPSRVAYDGLVASVPRRALTLASCRTTRRGALVRQRPAPPHPQHWRRGLLRRCPVRPRRTV